MTTTRPKSRGILLAILLILVIAAAFVLVRSNRQAPADAAVPTMTGTEVLRHAADSFATLRGLQFTLTSQPVVPGMQFSAVSKGEGSVIWPDKLVFSGIMQSTPTISAPVVLVMCGQDRYIDLAGDGMFLQVPGLPDVHSLLFGSDTGLVASVLKGLEQVSTPEAAKVGDVATWRVTGTVSPALLAKLPGAADTTASGTPLRAELWIGQQDFRLRQATLNGPMFNGDNAQSTRTFTFSGFDERLPLRVPRGQVPCGAQS